MDQITQEAWTKMIEKVSPQRPTVGKTVKVVQGRKHLGKTGKVTWHGVDKFYSCQYRTPAQLDLMDAIGRAGYRVRVQPDGAEPFFVSADYVEVM